MTKVYALHGNPGSPKDWEVLANHLPKEFELVSIDAHSDDWIKQLLSELNPVILIGHSYGCYRILKGLPAVKSKIAKVILICPYIAPERSLSLLSTILLKTPILGTLLIKANHSKTWEPFFESLIHPQEKTQLPYYTEIRDRLSNWKTWEKTVFKKIEMQENPWSIKDICNVKLEILFGDKDLISTEEKQMTLLSKYPNYKKHNCENAGHGLLWSAPEAITLLLKENQKTHIGYFNGSNEKNNVVSYMEKHLKDFPQRVALKWISRNSLAGWSGNHNDSIQHDQINYADFENRIQKFAGGLAEIGIKKGDRVIIFLPMSLDMYTSMFAVQRIGAIAVFLDSWARSSHLGASANCVTPNAMISFNHAFDLVNQTPEFDKMPIRILYGPGEKFTHRFEDLLKSTFKSPIAAVESESTALITFTTGSTGTPKGANRTHRFLSAQHLALDNVIPYKDTDKDMPAFPIFSLNNLAGGVTTVLPSIDLAAPNEKDGALMATQIIHEQLTCTTLSPSQLGNLTKFCKSESLRLSKLRRVVTGGAPISKDDVKSFYEVAPQSELWILYGSTEAEPMAHIEGREMLEADTAFESEVIEEGVNVGHISEDIEYKFIKLIDGNIQWPLNGWTELEVPMGEVGEFICTGDHVCREYYNNPEAFASTKILDNENKVWHRTGDLAYLDSHKRLWIVGRVNNAISRNNKYYFPVRPEVLLKRFNFTLRCAFLGMPDEKLGQSAIAAIELKNEFLNDFDAEIAKKEILDLFRKNNIPLDRIIFVKHIPMDPRHHSKVEYRSLRELILKDLGFIIV